MDNSTSMALLFGREVLGFTFGNKGVTAVDESWGAVVGFDNGGDGANKDSSEKGEGLHLGLSGAGRCR